MNQSDVLAAAQERINELAMSSLRGERDQAREWVVRLEGENARLIDEIRGALAALDAALAVSAVPTTRLRLRVVINQLRRVLE